MNGLRKIGILVEGTIGDSLILVPSLRMLKRQFGECEIELICMTDSSLISPQPVLAATFPDFKFTRIENSVGNDFFKRLGAWMRLCKYIRRAGLGIVVYAFRPENRRASSRAVLHWLIVKALTSASTLGFRVTKWPVHKIAKSSKRNLISKLLFERISDSLKSGYLFSDFDHRIEIAEQDAKVAKAWLDDNCKLKEQSYYVVCVSGKTSAQRWPLKNYVEVIQSLYQQYKLVPVFIGSSNEAKSHGTLINDLGFGYTTAGLSIGAASSIVKAGQFYLGNDTGPMHLAAALSLRCVVVQSSRNLEGTWDPLGHQHLVLRHSPACAGCGLIDCNLALQLCLINISVADVGSACRKIMSEIKPSINLSL